MLKKKKKKKKRPFRLLKFEVLWTIAKCFHV